MCTVTLIPKEKNNFIVTSSRDEAPFRQSLPPDYYQFKKSTLLFPKDVLSNGTWIGLSDKKRMICILNGGFENHIRQLPYRKSRGLIAKELLVADPLLETLYAYDFQNIEPFTAIIVDWSGALRFYELVWTGIKMHLTELPMKPKIWSSSTLYNKAMQQERLQWFARFESLHQWDAAALMAFHKTAGEGNDDYGIIMNRGVVKTTSITQVEKQRHTIDMRYEDLNNNTRLSRTFTNWQTIHA